MQLILQCGGVGIMAGSVLWTHALPVMPHAQQLQRARGKPYCDGVGGDFVARQVIMVQHHEVGVRDGHEKRGLHGTPNGVPNIGVQHRIQNAAHLGDNKL